MTHASFDDTAFEASGDPFDPPEDKWILARDLYLSGQTGEAVCAALGIRPSTFWRRASEGNWLRRDRPRALPEPEPLDMTAPVDDPAAAIDKVWRRVCAALDAGRSADALRWVRLHALLRGQADAERRQESRETLRDMDAMLRTTKGIKARAEAELYRRKALALEKEGITLKDSHPDPDSVSETPGLNRAERRRLVRELGKRRC